jgi:hypothetical protein
MQGDGRKEALQKPLVLDRVVVKSLLESGQNLRDADNSVIEQLGYSMNVWNGRAPSAGLAIGCGKSPKNAHVKNSIVLTLPRSDGEVAELSRPPTAKAIVRLMVECWDPDWVTWTTREWRRYQDIGREPTFGWLTYLSSSYTPPRDFPSGVTVETLGTGSLVIAADSVTHVTKTLLTEIHQAFNNDR